MGNRIKKEVAVEIAQKLTAAAKHERAAIVSDYSQALCVSEQSIYKAAKREGFETGRPTRSDHGSCRVSDDTMMRIAAIIHTSRNQKDRFELAAWNAIRIAQQSGIPNADQVTPSMLNVWMRRNRVSKKQALETRPAQEMRVEHSNEVHQIDTSQFAPVYLSNTGKLCRQTPGFDSGYKNKPDKGTPITRYVCTDHASGAFFVWYFAGAENARDMLHFLHLAWGARYYLSESEPAVYTLSLRELASYTTHSTIDGPAALLPVAGSPAEECPLTTAFPFRGIPKILYTDNGTSFKSKLFASVMENLCVRHETHAPGNSRATGSVERSHGIWQSAFEVLTRHEHFTSVEELNAKSLAFCAWFNAERKHRRHGRTRTAAWAEFLFDHELREMPDYNTFRSLAVLPRQVRTVKNGCITLEVPSQMRDLFGTGSLRYRIHDPNCEGKPVEVIPNLHDYPTVRVFCPATQQHYTCKPLHINALGYASQAAHLGTEYKRSASTDSERAAAGLATIAPVGGPELVRLEKPAAITPAQQIAHKQALAESQAINIVSIDSSLPAQGSDSVPALTSSEATAHALPPALVVSAPAITSAPPPVIHGAPFEVSRIEEDPLTPFAAKAELLERIGRSWSELTPGEQELITVRTAQHLTPTQVQELALALRAGDVPQLTQIQTEGA